MGEQGGEAMHVHLNNIRADLRGFSDELKMHLNSVKAQWAYSNPLSYHKNKITELNIELVGEGLEELLW